MDSITLTMSFRNITDLGLFNELTMPSQPSQLIAIKVSKVVSAILMTFFLTGCLGAKPFQPPPSTFRMWKKEGANSKEVKRAMLHCGYPNPEGINTNWSRNEIALVQECMYKQGFRRTDNYRICATADEANLPACHSHGISDLK